MSKLQHIAINILHSKYNILFTLLTYSIIYFCFYGDKMLAFCMNTNTNIIPEIAEAKPTRNITRSIIEREVSAFAGLTEALDECKRIINQQAEIIEEQKRTIAGLHRLNEETNDGIRTLQRQIIHKDSQYNTLKMHADKLQREVTYFYKQNKRLVQENDEFANILAGELVKPSRKR